MALPSDEVIAGLEKLITDQTRKNFINKYGSLLSLRPDAMFSALSDQMVNPDYLQKTTNAMSDYDRVFSRGGGYLSRGLQAKRGDYLSELDLKRREAINQYMESQKDLFNKWYTQEMYNYQTSEAPSQYTLSNFGLENPNLPKDYTVGSNTAKYKYNTPYIARDIFKYGGYANPKKLYSSPVPI